MSDENNSGEPNASRYADDLEIREALKNLTEAEKLKLDQIARQYTRAYFMDGEWETLFNEAIKLTLGGQEHWYKDKALTLFNHLATLIANLGKRLYSEFSVWDEKENKRLPRFVNDDSDANKEFWDKIKSEYFDIEKEYEQVELTNLLRDFFRTDPQAMEFILYRSMGYYREEIVGFLNISLVQFESIRKRIDRKKPLLRKHLSMNK